MARFYGKIGFGKSEKTAPGVYEDVIIERNYFGDVLENSGKLEDGEKVNSNFSVSNSISIAADAYAEQHFSNIKYIEWLETLWTVTNVKVVRPRLIIRMGEVYNGQVPASAPDAP